MIKRFLKSTFLFAFISLLSCGNSISQKQVEPTQTKETISEEKAIVLGANRTGAYLPMLKNKTIGIVGNQSSLVKVSDKEYVHLVDTLMKLDATLIKVFAPEHGFRGTADAGEAVKDGKDPKTGLPVISLYGDNKKPKKEQLEGIDILLFDLQDVGARFYTYISTLHYVMEACAENNISLIILDRPNPNGHYMDGPILDPNYKSFVGMHPIPVVHGMTMGEYAKMINGEKWLNNGVQCDLKVIEMENYDHSLTYSLPVKPSPNLPNERAINLYPSLCFFEGTNVNAGRGTQKQFQVFGSPFLKSEKFTYRYTPISMDGAKYPKHQNKECVGMDLSEGKRLSKINLEWLIDTYNNTTNKSDFFNNFFIKLAGTPKLQEQIEQGMSAQEIRATWQPGLEKFNQTRSKYLIYN